VFCTKIPQNEKIKKYRRNILCVFNLSLESRHAKNMHEHTEKHSNVTMMFAEHVSELLKLCDLQPSAGADGWDGEVEECGWRSVFA
jgi:hypothetical protein